MTRSLWVVVIGVLVTTMFTTGPLLAQSKVSTPTAIWPELQVTYGVGEGGLFFVQNQYRINTDSRFNNFRESGLLSNVERLQFSMGYEHTFSSHWRAGALGRYAAENVPATIFYGLFLRHNGALKSLFFNKQLLLEYAHQKGGDAVVRYRFMAELGKRIHINQRYLTPSVGYEAALFTEPGVENSIYNDRFIDRAQLRFNLTYEVNSKLYITPYFMRQSAYYYVEVSPVYDENDILIKDGYRTKRNIITPVFGLEIKYNLNSQVNTASFAY